MARIRGRYWFSIGAVAIGLFWVLSAAQSGQQIPGFFGIFGGMINSAIIDSARREWQSRPLSDYNCLTSHGVSADQLASRGIGPDDPQVRQILSQCAVAAPTAPVPVAQQPAEGPVEAAPSPNYVVNGLALGAPFNPQSDPAASYACRASDDFPGFSWCSSHHVESGKFGPNTIWMSVFHSDTNAAVEITEAIEPAFFQRGDVEGEIQRLSRNFGQQARVKTADLPSGGRAVIAVWGAVSLTALDSTTMDALSRGAQVHSGLLVGFLGDLRASAHLSLPVYSLGGGAGFIWNVEYDSSGKGVLRITAVDPSLLPGAPSVERAPSKVSTYAPTAAITPTPIPTPTVDPAQAEKERAARAEKAIAAANAQLDDVGTFIKEHPRSPKLLDYIDRIGALSAAVKTGDPDNIENKLTDLNNSLSHDEDYQQHLAVVAEAQKKHAAQYLGDAIRRGEQERDFLLDFIGKNPLADSTPAFAAYVKQLNPALQRADLNQLQPLVDKVDLAIREANLETAFIAVQKQSATLPNASAETPAAPAATPEPAQSTKMESPEELPITEKNRFLVAGDLDDVEILYNASSSAPHVAQNLRGDFVFAQHQARVCLFGQSPDELALIVKQTIAAKSDPRQVAVLVEPCNADQLLTYDVVATQRGAFLRSKKEDALALIKIIENDNYRKLAEVTAADLNKVADAERAQVEKIKANVADGTPDGFGVVLLRTRSPNLCLAVGTKITSHRQLLLRAEGKLNLEMQTEVVIKDTNIDDAFINIQKRQCGAVYASAGDLKTLTAALARNNTPYGFSVLWNSPADVEKEDSALAERARLATQEETERAQRNADRSRLAAAREQDLNAAQAAQQATLRQKYGDSAKGAAATLSSEIIAWSKDQSGQVGGAYPAFATWLADKLADHWEITTIDSAVEDYGTSNFKTRTLETVFSKVTVHMKNRMLGEYVDPCFIFGRINDAEFTVSRDPVVAKCDDEAAVRTWQAGHQFKSEWFAAN